MKRFFLCLAWLFLSSGVIFTTVATYHFYLSVHAFQYESPQSTNPPVAISSDAPIALTQVAEVITQVEAKDARAQLVTNFLKRHNSPMQPHEYYGKKLVEIADEVGIDFRLLPAIAMQESNLCKVIPADSYNCLGLGVHSRGTWGFESYETNFATAGKILKEQYIDKGLTTPEQIMRKYTPSSNGSWASSVNQWMAEMRYDDRASGREKKMDADLTEFLEQIEE